NRESVEVSQPRDEPIQGRPVEIPFDLLTIESKNSIAACPRKKEWDVERSQTGNLCPDDLAVLVGRCLAQLTGDERAKELLQHDLALNGINQKGRHQALTNKLVVRPCIAVDKPHRQAGKNHRLCSHERGFICLQTFLHGFVTGENVIKITTRIGGLALEGRRIFGMRPGEIVLATRPETLRT